MYELYYAPGSASLAVHWLLIELGVEHRLHRVNLAAGEHKTDHYRAINPAGVVPALVINGQAVSESAALVLALADRHPQAGLAPDLDSLERATYYQWAFFCANTLQPAFRNWFYPQEAAGVECQDHTKEQARLKIEAAFAQVNAHLDSRGPYLCGDQLRAVDFSFAMLTRWSRGMPKPAREWPAIKAYTDRLCALPSFAQVCTREELTGWP